MSILRIEDAINLQNYRESQKDSKTPLHRRKITKANLSRYLWPGAKNSKVNMSYYLSGKSTNFDSRFVGIICDKCGVDANFLFGQESVHDGDFSVLNTFGDD